MPQSSNSTPNLDRLEAIYVALGGSVDISRQPNVTRVEGWLWTVTRRTGDGFWIGQSDTLSGALGDLHIVQSKPEPVPTVAALERIAA